MIKSTKNLIKFLVMFLFIFKLVSMKIVVNGMEISGNIKTNTVWENNEVYVVNGLVVDAGATLTIKAGTIIKVKASTTITINGSLLIEGTSDNFVYITSYLDDIGGDTNCDKNATIPQTGDWNRLVFSNGSSGNLNYTVIRYASRYDSAWNNNLANLEINNNVSININNSEIRYGRSGIRINDLTGNVVINNTNICDNNNGIHLENSNASIIGNTFNNNQNEAIFIKGSSDSVIKQNNFNQAKVVLQDNACGTHIESNNENLLMIELISANISTDLTLQSLFPYVITNGINIASGKTLNIESGVIIKVKLAITLSVNGTLNTNGKIDDFVYITSYLDDIGGDTNGDKNATIPQMGDWNRLVFSNGSSGNLNYTVIRYASRYESYNYNYSNIDIIGSSNVTINNSEISYSRFSGLTLSNVTGSVLINNCTFHHNVDSGIKIVGSSPLINNCQIYHNGTGLFIRNLNCDMFINDVKLYENNQKDIDYDTVSTRYLSFNNIKAPKADFLMRPGNINNSTYINKLMVDKSDFNLYYQLLNNEIDEPILLEQLDFSTLTLYHIQDHITHEENLLKKYFIIYYVDDNNQVHYFGQKQLGINDIYNSLNSVLYFEDFEDYNIGHQSNYLDLKYNGAGNNYQGIFKSSDNETNKVLRVEGVSYWTATFLKSLPLIIPEKFVLDAYLQPVFGTEPGSLLLYNSELGYWGTALGGVTFRDNNIYVWHYQEDNLLTQIKIGEYLNNEWYRITLDCDITERSRIYRVYLDGVEVISNLGIYQGTPIKDISITSGNLNASMMNIDNLGIYSQVLPNKVITFNDNTNNPQVKTINLLDYINHINAFPVDPIYNDFEFDGWWLIDEGKYSKITIEDEFLTDTTLYARWLAAINYPDGKIIKVYLNDSLILDDFEHCSYEFGGWYNKEGLDGDYGEKVNSGDIVLDNMKLYPMWLASVSFINEDIMETIKIPLNQKIPIIPSNPTKENYHFDGWWTKDDSFEYTNQLTTEDVIIDNMIFYSKWIPKKLVQINDAYQVEVYDGKIKVFLVVSQDELDGFSVFYKKDNIDVEPINAGSYDVYITRLEDDIYQSFTKVIKSGLIVDKQSVLAPNNPILISISDVKIIIETNIKSEYSIDGVNWQTTETFDQLRPETEYIIMARMIEDENHYASFPSDGLIVRTYHSSTLTKLSLLGAIDNNTYCLDDKLHINISNDYLIFVTVNGNAQSVIDGVVEIILDNNDTKYIIVATDLLGTVVNWTINVNNGHHYGPWIVSKPATINEPGERYRVCEFENHYEYEVIPKLENNGCSCINCGKINLLINIMMVLTFLALKIFKK